MPNFSVKLQRKPTESVTNLPQHQPNLTLTAGGQITPRITHDSPPSHLLDYLLTVSMQQELYELKECSYDYENVPFCKKSENKIGNFKQIL